MKKIQRNLRKVMLPQYAPSHKNSEKSLLWLRSLLIDYAVVDEIHKDYGIDVQINVVIDGSQVTGMHFVAQIKSADEVKFNQRNGFSYQLKTSTIRYFLDRPERVALIVYDDATGVGYWCWVQEYIRQLKSQRWRTQQTVSIAVSQSNVLNHAAIEAMIKTVQAEHAEDRSMRAARDSSDEHYHVMVQHSPAGAEVPHYGVMAVAYTFGNVQQIFHLIPRHPHATEASPITVRGTIRPEILNTGETAVEAFERAMRTGGSVIIPGSAMGNIEFSDHVRRLFDDTDLQWQSLHVQPLISNLTHRVRIEAINTRHMVAASLPDLTIHEIQRGTDEVTFTSKDSVWEVRVVLNRIQLSIQLNICTNLNNIDAVTARNALRIWDALAGATQMRITFIDRAEPILHPIRNIEITNPDFMALVETLAAVQERTGRILRIGETIHEQQIQHLPFINEVLQTGQTRIQHGVLRVGLHRSDAATLRAEYPIGTTFPFMLKAECELPLLDTSIPLGEMHTILHTASWNLTDGDPLATPDDANEAIIVCITPGEAGVILSFPQWLPPVENGEPTESAPSSDNVL